MRYVSCMGYLYRLSETSYRKMLRSVAEGDPCSLREVGKELGEVENVTDLSAFDANEKLKYIGARPVGCRCGKGDCPVHGD